MQTYKPKNRFNAQRPALKPEDNQKMIDDSRALLIVEFHVQEKPGGKAFWSKCGQRKHKNMNDAINYLIWLVSGYEKWKGKVLRAAIFDTRVIKTGHGANKIYQFDNGFWQADQPFTW